MPLCYVARYPHTPVWKLNLDMFVNILRCPSIGRKIITLHRTHNVAKTVSVRQHLVLGMTARVVHTTFLPLVIKHRDKIVCVMNAPFRNLSSF